MEFNDDQLSEIARLQQVLQSLKNETLGVENNIAAKRIQLTSIQDDIALLEANSNKNHDCTIPTLVPIQPDENSHQADDKQRELIKLMMSWILFPVNVSSV
jgi:hypothetical protein